MTLEQTILGKLRTLPPEKQREVLDFVDSLEPVQGKPRPRRSLRGLWADLEIEITEKDLAAVRREMWDKFPRNDI